MNESTIKIINEKCSDAGISWEQGVFVQPNHIPTNMKAPVVYARYETGGYEYNGANPKPYTESRPKNHLQVLDIVLGEIAPSCNFLQYREIERSIITMDHIGDQNWYGCSTNYQVDYIKVSDLEKILSEMEV